MGEGLGGLGKTLVQPPIHLAADLFQPFFRYFRETAHLPTQLARIAVERDLDMAHDRLHPLRQRLLLHPQRLRVALLDLLPVLAQPCMQTLTQT